MWDYNAKNYTEQGGEVTHISGRLIFDKPILPNQPACTGTTNGEKAVNALLSKLKSVGIMAADAFMLLMATLRDDAPGHENRSYNTENLKMTSIDNENHVINVTFRGKVSELKDYNDDHGKGVHKWFGLCLTAGVTPITKLSMNGTPLTNEDVTEASQCGAPSGYFVKWFPADLIFAGDKSEGDYGSFTLTAEGYPETTYTMQISENAGE